MKKLFGHSGDIVCLAGSPCGRYIASAGKGRNSETSAIFIWETYKYCFYMIPSYNEHRTLIIAYIMLTV
jgi:hypothetical protein